MKIRKKFVFNNNGFTLLEALLGLFVMAILVLLIMQATLLLNSIMYDNYNSRQTVLFSIQTNRDIFAAKDIYTTNQQLVIDKYSGDQVTYLEKNNKLIRKVNDKGHEIILNNVDKIYFENYHNYINMEVKFLNEDGIHEQVISTVKI